MKPRIYVDTSVLGGYVNQEFHDHSRRLVDAFVRGDYTLVLSELTLRELEAAPGTVRQLVDTVPDSNVETLAVSVEADELASDYIREGAVSSRMRADALHIAVATVGRVDVLVSWNFRHIVNLRRIHVYNAVNIKRGYPMLEIRSPRELIGDE